MACRFTELVVDSRDPERLASFWQEVLGWQPTGQYEGQGPVEIADPSGAGPSLVFVPVPDGKHGKNRLHLDLNPVGSGQEEELDRLLSLGARPIDIGQWRARPDGYWELVIPMRQP